MTDPKPYSLDDKYLLDDGTVALSGVQALVRLPIDQHKADARAGLNTATLISGYRGSPLGGFDFLLQGAKRILEQHQVRFLPGVNEDLGATAIFGSQLANLMPSPKYDGVLGIWYGKGPGVDRSGDALKHANLTGVGKNGGVPPRQRRDGRRLFGLHRRTKPRCSLCQTTRSRAVKNVRSTSGDGVPIRARS